MKLNTWIAGASAALLVFGTAAQASDDRPSHFKGKESASWSVAQENLTEYNQKLSDILAKNTLSPQDLAQVHELTYTLENALERMEKDIESIAETLENVHVASETNQPEVVKKEGAMYLDRVKAIANK